jgi:hypothetical protein
MSYLWTVRLSLVQSDEQVRQHKERVLLLPQIKKLKLLLSNIQSSWVWPIHMAFAWNKVSRTQLFHLWHTFHVLVWAAVHHSQWILDFIFVQGHPNWPKRPNVHKAKVKQAGTIKHHCASEVEVTPTTLGGSQPGSRWLGEVKGPRIWWWWLQ